MIFALMPFILSFMNWLSESSIQGKLIVLEIVIGSIAVFIWARE